MEQGKRKVQAKNLTKRFGELLVLDDISFDVMEGEFLCIVGPTGCGKTTFLNCLTKLYDITNGEILVDGAPINCKKNNISYILQESSAMEWLTVEQNIQFGLGIKRMPAGMKKERTEEMLELVGLTEYRNYYPKQLSISMLQRTVIARVLLHIRNCCLWMNLMGSWIWTCGSAWRTSWSSFGRKQEQR